MTSGRIHSPELVVLLLSLTAAGCGGTSQGCIQCSPIDGRYALEFGDGMTPGTCQGVTVTLPQGPLDMTRQGSELTAQLDGLTLRGTLYQTNDFNLLGTRAGSMDGGTAGLESENLTGRYVAGVGDGGVDKLIGDWQGNFASTSTGGTRRCSVTRPFTATRQ
ncbi:hypothetical protein [Cystobacter ferrugineus]|uniref:Lipoprotein n=1 Tax=Cystobacter ferrugineus TaxID=83449 RepID=A0A1L9B9L8_9BACT|nr:hypothetical protein [Cystobacter ferrugineus]OJH38954.1 hypothetical protein BON30_22355 [Cystobacter ferrugineus]